MNLIQKYGNFIMTCEDFEDYQVLSAVKVDDAFDDDLPF